MICIAKNQSTCKNYTDKQQKYISIRPAMQILK